MKFDAMQWTRERHTFYWNKLLAEVKHPTDMDVTEPEIRFSDRVSNVAGRANCTWTEYNLNYLFSENKMYEFVIAHELVHVIIGRIRRHRNNIERVNGGHCPLFFYIFQVVLGFQEGCRHHFAKPKLHPTVKLMRQVKFLQKCIDNIE